MRRVCLDTNIIISILINNRGNHRSTDEWDGIKEIASDIDRGVIQLVLPTIVFSELLPSHLGVATIDVLERLFRRKAVELHDLTYRIARRSAELRDAAKLGSGKVLKTVDAIFLATAELAPVDELYSSDPDIYKAVGAKVRLLKPKSSRLSLLPDVAFPQPWLGS